MANPVDLRFWRPVTPTPGAVDLRFGEPAASTGVVGSLSAVLPAAVLPAVTLLAAGGSRRGVVGTLASALPAPAIPALTFAAEEYVERTLGALAATLPSPTLPALVIASASITYDPALPDAVGPGILARHVAVRDEQAALVLGQQAMRPARTSAAARAQQATPLVAGAGIGQQQMTAASRASVQRARHGIPLGHGYVVSHADTLRLRRTCIASAQHGVSLGGGVRAGHQERIRTRRRLRADQQQGAAVRATAAVRAQQARQTATPLYMGHQHAAQLPVGWWQATYPWPEPPLDPNAPSSPVRMRFCRLADGSAALVFGCRPLTPGAVVTVPILGAYVVLNDFSLTRVDTGQPVEVEEFSATLDADSWTWGWSASLHAALMPLVRSPALDEHVELLATLNGTPVRLVVERMARDRRFAASRLRISGRGRAAWLAAPHAPVEARYNTAARTAQQLLADALTINGVSIGWAVDWRLTDWLVPAGAWSHQGTYMDAAMRIAEAGGGYVQAHDTEQRLIVLPRYPAAPWHWATQTPDIDLPEDACEVEGIEWQDRPAYDAVWVHGGESGRRDRIRRAGTAADRTAPTIVDALATAPEMTRQRGLAALGDTGRQAHISLRLPVLPETGIIVPGKLIRYTESGVSRVGLSRSVQVDHRFPELWQTIRIETHEVEAP